MGEWAKAKIQLCGRFAVDIDGHRIEGTLPGRRGRVLFMAIGPLLEVIEMPRSSPLSPAAIVARTRWQRE